jgi:hypothetical protein
MQYNDVKQCLMDCPELKGLTHDSMAALFWRGQEQRIYKGDPIYLEDMHLDDTFCLLLSGTLQIERNGVAIGQIFAPQVFGEMAYFTASHSRTATVRAASPDTAILRIKLSTEELGSPQFANFKHFLGREAWDRFVSTSQEVTEKMQP